MPQYSLTVSQTGPGRYRWLIVLLEYPHFFERESSRCSYFTYEAALEAGNRELARLDHESLLDRCLDPDQIGWG